METEMKLHPGRPASPEGRAPREVRVYDYLDGLGIPYQQMDHPPADTMEICRQRERLLGCTICKNLFLTNRNQSKFYLLCMPGEKPFKTREIADQIGSSRLSFAPEDKMLEYLDILPGSVSVMGLMNDAGHHVQLLVDRDVLAGEFFGCHPCVNTSSLRLHTEDVFGKYIAATGHSCIPVTLTGV